MIDDIKDRIYIVRLKLPALGPQVGVYGTKVDAAHVKKMMPRAKAEGLSLEELYRAIAIDSIRMGLERQGFDCSLGQVVECRQSTMEELQTLSRQYLGTDPIDVDKQGHPKVPRKGGLGPSN